MSKHPFLYGGRGQRSSHDCQARALIACLDDKVKSLDSLFAFLELL